MNHARCVAYGAFDQNCDSRASAFATLLSDGQHVEDALQKTRVSTSPSYFYDYSI